MVAACGVARCVPSASRAKVGLARYLIKVNYLGTGYHGSADSGSPRHVSHSPLTTHHYPSSSGC